MILIIGDPHFKSSNKIETDILLKKTLKTITKKQVDFVVILGDILDNHEKIDMFCFKRVENFIEQISSLTKVYIIIGNHDRPNNRVFLTDEHAFGAFKKWNNVIIIDDKCETITWNDKKICIVPYVPNGRFLEALQVNNIIPNEYNLFFAHSEFKGCKINNLSKSECDKWPDDYPLLLSGHIHDYEEVQKNLIYLGTPYQQTYAEKSGKGIYLLDDDFKLELIKLGIKQKITKTIKAKEVYDVEIDEDVELKLIIVGTKDEIKSISNNPTLNKKFKNVKIVFKKIQERKRIVEFKGNMSFENHLKISFEDNKDLKEIFYEIFS